MMNCSQLKELIIKPALIDLLLYSEEAMELMVFTCANESNGGEFLKQVDGSALGIFQMEPATYNDLWINYINHKPGILLQLQHLFSVNGMPSEERMVYDLRFATAMARIKYGRVTEPLPLEWRDTEGLYVYYKKYYNSDLGKANYAQALSKYLKLIKN